MKIGLVRGLMCILGTAFFVENVFGGGGGGETFKEGINYIPIKPALVVNYGSIARVRYIKAEISLRTEDATNAAEVAHHMPLIRDTLIMLISGVTDEQMGSGEGKEKMRQEALAQINEALEEIDNPSDEHEEPAKPTKDEHKKDEKPKGEAEKGDHPKEHAKKKRPMWMGL